MKVDKYDIVYNPATKTEEYYAVSGKKRILMPSAFKDMYNDDYLEIELTHLEMPELFDIATNEFFIPRRTSGVE